MTVAAAEVQQMRTLLSHAHDLLSRHACPVCMGKRTSEPGPYCAPDHLTVPVRFRTEPDASLPPIQPITGRDGLPH